MEDIIEELSARKSDHTKYYKKNFFWRDTLAQVNVTLSITVPFGLVLAYIFPGRSRDINLLVLALSLLALAGLVVDNAMHFRDKARFHSLQAAKYSDLIFKLNSGSMAKQQAIDEAQKIMLNDAEEP